MPLIEFEEDDTRANVAQMQADLAKSIVQGLSKPCPKKSSSKADGQTDDYTFTKSIPTVVLYDEKGAALVGLPILISFSGLLKHLTTWRAFPQDSRCTPTSLKSLTTTHSRRNGSCCSDTAMRSPSACFHSWHLPQPRTSRR